ncbi:MAG: phosphoglucomutase, alpha-D-glucose phosphate-specific, partial [Candidatus Omnitrophica bacterium]|nr:phosphoglucomutase, alpha-D-glucose phosphate-specific [Candidatus Omnitrophota bacterium]
SAYYDLKPQGEVLFGTSGHRGSSLAGTFNEMHVAAMSAAICEYRQAQSISGPLYLGFDPHALSRPAFKTALEVFAANDVTVCIQADNGYTPTPVISFLIIEYNKGKTFGLADGVVITSSHNPPQDGGFKYNPAHGGPADVEVTTWIQDQANQLMAGNNQDVKRISYEKALKAGITHQQDFITPFVKSLADVIDMEAISKSKIKIGVDPMGGAGIYFWEPIAQTYGLDLDIVNKEVDPTFSFMRLDHDGEIRMDCSSPSAMAGLIALADKYDIAWGNDTDYDRHGIVCPTGLMNPNHYLAAAIWYLCQNRPDWKRDLKIGKTIVSSSIIDKVVTGLGKQLYEVPVGFKWFVSGLLNGEIAFGGEESAGASFLRKDGTVWTTDKDGFCMTLLSAEILVKTGKTPQEIYDQVLIPQYGRAYYKRSDGPIEEEQKDRLKQITHDSIKAASLAGKSIVSIQTTALGNKASIGGVKINLEDGSWFAVRPS